MCEGPERFILKFSQYCKYHETDSGPKLRPHTQGGGEITPSYCLQVSETTAPQMILSYKIMSENFPKQ